MSTFIKVKRVHPDAVLPSQDSGDVGWDLSAIEGGFIPTGQVRIVPTGWILGENPYDDDPHKKILLKIEGRSGLAMKHSVFPVGGIIDPSYRGEIGVMLYNGGERPYQFEKGDRVAQIVIYSVHGKSLSSKTAFIESDAVFPSERGDKGFGSSGR